MGRWPGGTEPAGPSACLGKGGTIIKSLGHLSVVVNKYFSGAIYVGVER